MSLVLLPMPADPDDPALVRWRVGPGLVRKTGQVDAADLPTPLADLAAEGTVESVWVTPGEVRTRLGADHTAAADGRRIRGALHEILTAPGGWPDAHEAIASDEREAVRQAADAEVADAVRAVLAGSFGMYTASHGGAVELVGVENGDVTVRLTGHCHGCAAANNTLQSNLAAQLLRVPGFRSLHTVGYDETPQRSPRTWLSLPGVGRRGR